MMPKTPLLQPAFLRDVKRYKAKHYDEKRLTDIITLLCNGASKENLAPYNDHPLKGNYKGMRDLHVYPDVVLIYQITRDSIIFVRLASHDDLF